MENPTAPVRALVRRPCAFCRGEGVLRQPDYELYSHDPDCDEHVFAFCCEAHLADARAQYPQASVTPLSASASA